jgi:hypothetical protein
MASQQHLLVQSHLLPLGLLFKVLPQVCSGAGDGHGKKRKRKK